MKIRRAAVPVLLAALAVAPVLAQSVEDVFPLEPKDGGLMGPKGTFRLGVKGTDIFKMKFRILLSKDGFETIATTLDQTKNPDGWGFWAQADEDEQPVVCYVRRPIPDGDYEWRVSAWNGVNWVDGKRTFRLRVDAVPPADVTGVRMRLDRDQGAVVLDWDPVVTDRDGRPEQVARYKIYRYQRKSVFFVARLYEVGTTTDTHFEDTGEIALKTPLLYYKISAEDEAGNEAGSLTDRLSAAPAPPEPPRRPPPGGTW